MMPEKKFNFKINDSKAYIDSDKTFIQVIQKSKNHCIWIAGYIILLPNIQKEMDETNPEIDHYI